MKYIENCTVNKNEKIIDDIYRMELKSNKIVKDSKAGQFLEIKVNNLNYPLLRRPISINEINLDENLLVIYYKTVGKGTKILSQVKKGEKLSVVGPLGNGFDTSYEGLNIGIVGGGIGIAPLVELAKSLYQKNNVNIYLGFNDKPYLINRLNELSNIVKVSTVSGSYGYKGFITEVLEKDIKEGNLDLLYACGPKGMLKKIKDIAKEFNIRCQVSLEERMGCGIGACLGCSIEVNGQMKKVCVDGPVFWSNEVNLDE
ncbi:dihydroorotate dehydrogenase electron transfer subunit [Thermohalobacter berrensis]|uniref:Dihydroorotate dehydrogenase B (NAD(+)), electron transfer subunit n=1 Tax=Thermohalobacter berrensis TaxID=99594 RepID=A0A419TA42_9FIRM|nr:dihydroorotate dehydrogenase electron transfer subunit [Thermohalobacter berrensis]RKD34350.1 hypothetical protein BET03_00515 [Thermohalobacter berrensis]